MLESRALPRLTEVVVSSSGIYNTILYCIGSDQPGQGRPIQRRRKGEPMSDLPQGLRRLLTAAAELEPAVPLEEDSRGHRIGARLRDSVLRPLQRINAVATDGDGSAMGGPEPSERSAHGE